MTRQNCRNSICRKKIWRRLLRRWGKTHWKFTNNVSSLLRTLCNFGTRSGCYQEHSQVMAWGLEKAPIKYMTAPVSVIGNWGGFCAWLLLANAAHLFYMTRQNCRNSICRKKIWRRLLRRWGKTHWKFTNNVSSLLRTLCNFGTRSGCYQEHSQVMAWGLEKAPIKYMTAPVSVIGNWGGFCVGWKITNDWV